MSGSRAVRALTLVLLGYGGVRTAWVWMPGFEESQAVQVTAKPPQASLVPSEMAVMSPIVLQHPFPGAGRSLGETVSPRLRPAPGNASGMENASLPAAFDALRPASVLQAPSTPPIIPTRPAASPRPTSTPPSRWSGYAYLFQRGDGGAPALLAPAGQISGSQAAARLAYRLDDAGRITVSARFATPLRTTAQAEAAVGADLIPVPGLRLSIERRIGLGRDGRNAFAAYAAGGLYRALAPRIELDGYAQAGMVGLRRRDPFADAALRLHHRTSVRPDTDLRLGLGAWGAAQPGASRLDIGPRVAVTTPVDRLAVTLAVDARFRVAGHARPGNGIALTLATDF